MAIDVAVLRALLEFQSKGAQDAVRDANKVKEALENTADAAAELGSEVTASGAATTKALTDAKGSVVSYAAAYEALAGTVSQASSAQSDAAGLGCDEQPSK